MSVKSPIIHADEKLLQIGKLFTSKVKNVQ